jgi:hypothetical protein
MAFVCDFWCGIRRGGLIHQIGYDLRFRKVMGLQCVGGVHVGYIDAGTLYEMHVLTALGLGQADPVHLDGARATGDIAPAMATGRKKCKQRNEVMI